jgi:DNA polymerase III subunit epsilon
LFKPYHNAIFTALGELMTAKHKFPIKLERPLAFIDIEATGTLPRQDRIVELAIVKILPDSNQETKVLRINPGMPIPAGAMKIHGITDEAVKDCPKFPDVADEVLAFLHNCDLAGFNVIRYDITMLTEELSRAGHQFSLDGRRIIDAQRIFHQKEPRDLTAALSFYCGEMHLNAHGAEADVLATIQVLEGQLKHYADLPRNLDELDKYCNPRDPSWADTSGRLRWDNGILTLNFGKKKGEPLKTTIENDPGFARWLLRSDFPADTKRIVSEAVNGLWPAAPAVSDQAP